MKRLSKFHVILLLLSVSFNLLAQDSGKSFKEVDTNIINLDRSYYSNSNLQNFQERSTTCKDISSINFGLLKRKLKTRQKERLSSGSISSGMGLFLKPDLIKIPIQIMEIGLVVSFSMLRNIFQEPKTEKPQDSRLN